MYNKLVHSILYIYILKSKILYNIYSIVLINDFIFIKIKKKI